MRAARAAALVDNARPRHYAQPMLRLLALSLLALAGSQAVAEQVHPCQAETPPCSLAMAQARHYLDELDRKAGYAPTTPRVVPQFVAANSRTAAQVYPYQAENSSCSVELELTRHELALTRRELDEALYDLDEARYELDEAHYDEGEARLELAQALRDEEKASRELDELIGETGPAAWETTAERLERYNRTRQPRHYAPYPLSRELLTGAVNPCDSAYASCPPELDRIYDGLERNHDDEDSWHYEYYQNRLEDYYRHYRP